MPARLLVIIGTALAFPAHAQLTAPVKSGDTTITVTGTREAKNVEMSDWLMAETPHVVVFKQAVFITADEKELRETARNLEKLHFLLSTLLGRANAPDDTMKIAVMMIGRAGEFERLKLSDLRWQYGPFPPQFEKTLYYDPREEGSVLATTKDGVNLVLSPSRGRPTNRNCDGSVDGKALVSTAFRPTVTPSGSEEWAGMAAQLPVNELAFCLSAESRLYAVFAQNYLLTYFPAAYPRWFLQGFGEIFATLTVGDDHVEYGRVPTGYYEVMKHFDPYYPVTEVFDGRYLSGRGRAWTPYHAWRLVHLLYFSDEWKPRLHEYLDAVARGTDPRSAARAFGDPARLQKALSSYRRSKFSFERMAFSSEQIQEPVVRRLTRAEAGLIRGRLEMGARLDLPPEDSPEYSAALAKRAAWLEQLRENARQYPNMVEHHLLLAEAECRTGHSQACLDAADLALDKSPRDTTARVWQGTALAQLAANAPAEERQQRLAEARALIVRANRRDPDGILPLIAYYNSFIVAGERPHDMAVEGMAKVVHSSPAAPTARLKLGEEFIRRGLVEGARKTLLPVAHGAFDSPEKPAAAASLKNAAASDR